MPVLQSWFHLGRLRNAMILSIFLTLLSSCNFSFGGATQEAATPPAVEPGQAAPAATTGPTATPPPTVSPTPMQVAAVQPAANAAGVTANGALYNGEVVAQRELNLVAEVSGQVLEVLVEVGDKVAMGEPLVRIDNTVLEAQRAQALAGLEAAQAQLDLLTTPADEADLAAARASVAAAGAAYRNATDGATAEDLRLAEAQLRSAQAGVSAAQAAYNRVKGDLNINSRPEALQLQQAKLQVEAAQARYDQVLKGATQDVIAGAYAQLAQAQALLKNLEQGANAEQIQAVEAQVQAAEAALYLAQMQVNKAVIYAPMDGVVARVATSPGAMVGSGALAVVLLSTSVEVTIPVEELRLPSLQVGQLAMIQVAAYPDKVYPGEIVIIAPIVDAATRTVEVTIRPTEEASDLAPGMFATVELLSEE
jgi:HlyD family secretion protein